MADDIQSNIRINIDTASAMDSIRLLQNQISAFHTQMSKMGAASVADSRNMQQNLINSINSTGAFTANMTKVKTTAEQFTSSLEKNKLSMGEYFRYAGGATKSFGKLFQAEFETINKVARERVKDLQSQYIKLGRDANGAMQAIRVRPLTLDMDNLATKTQIAAQRQQLLNQLLKQGSTNLLNFGKNTQWAGRQLMVGFTIPLTIMGGAAMKAYKEIEEASIRLKRVYGDFGTTAAETDKMVKQVQALALEYTKYGIAVKDSMEVAATAAATGKKGADLLAQVAQANRLSALGGIEQQKALQTTISLTDAFSISAKDLSKNINFLNAVENQTTLSIDDLTTAIPKAAPVIQQLGGDVKDLAFFLTAMKEGGINASEGANAIKSGLASIINPTNTASKMLQGFGINLRGIVNDNKGDVKKTVVDFAKALDTLDPINRAKAIEQLFGKFQFARMSTLFKNVIEQGSQASEVLKLANQSSLELSMLAQRELGKIEASPLYKFQKALADFQAQLAPVGEQFMKAITPIINFGTDVLKNFNNLGDGVKGFIVKFVAVAGVIGPVLLMSFGLIANAVANVIKGFALMKDIFNKTGKSSLSLGEQVNYMTQEQIQAAAIASSLDQVHSKLKQTFTSEAAAVDMLTGAYERSVAAQRAFGVPITPRGPVGKGPVRKYAAGGIISGPGTGTSDSILAMVSNGEAIIPAASVARNPGMVRQLVSGNIPGFRTGRLGSGATGRIGKSGMAVVRPYGENVSNTSGVVDFLDIDSQNLAEVSSLYSKQIIQEAGTSAGKINAEVRAWRDKNIVAITKATALVDSGVPAQKAFSELSQKFKLDMEAAQGPVHKFTQTAQSMMPKLSEDLRIAQTKASQLGLNIRKAADASALQLALPNNIAAKGLANPGAYMPLAAARGSAASIFGGTSGISTYGIPRFMLPQNLHPSSTSYKLGTSQEHLSQTLVQQQNLEANRLARQTGKVEAQKLALSAAQGMAEEGQMRSPSRVTKQKGAQLVQGAVQGMQEGVDDVRRAGSQLGQAAAQGVSQSGRASRRSTSEGNMVYVDGRGYVSEGQLARDVALANAPAIGPREGTKAEKRGFTTAGRGGKISNLFSNIGNSAGNSIKNMSQGKFQGGMFGASMIAGLGSMVGGPVGEVSGALSMPLAIAGMFPKLQGVLGGIVGGLTKFIPVIGTALVAWQLWDQVAVPLIRKNADSYEALATTLNVTKEKIDGINNFFGTEGKLTGLATATVGLAGQNKKQASIAEQFRQSEDFKTTYQEQANKLKNLSNQEVKRTMQGLGEQLVGSGFGVDAAQAIVQAILLESGKKDVKIDFASFNLGEKTKESLNNDLDMSFSLYKNNFEKTGLFDVEQIAKTEVAISQIAAALNAVSGQFELGVINGKEFNTNFDALARGFYRLENSNPGQGIDFMDKALKIVNPTIADASINVTDFTSKINILKAATAGLSLNADIFNTLANGSATEKAKQNAAITTALNRQLALTREIDKQRKIQTGLSNSTKDINKLEEKINEKYNKRISQIEKIKKLNDQIAQSQQGQLTLAEALNQGDVGAAARAAIDIQKNDIQNALDQQKTGLDAARQSELDPLKGQRDAVQNSVDAMNTVINDLQKKLSNIQIEVVITDGNGSTLNSETYTNPNGKTVELPRGYTTQEQKADSRQPWNQPSYKKMYPSTKDDLRGYADRERYWTTANRGNYTIEDGIFKLKQANGGHITGPGSGTSDSIPAMLSNGEYVIRANAVKKIGVDTLDKLNQADKMGFAAGGMVRKFKGGGYNGYEKGGKVKNWDLKDPTAPWNQGDFKKFNDYQTRKQYWAMSQPGSREIVDAGKTAGYFMPGVGAGLSFGDAGTAFGKGDVGGGLLNTAFGFASKWLPEAIGMVGKGIGAAKSFIETGIATMNAKKVLGIMGGKEASKLTPEIGVKMTRTGLENFINQGKYKTIHEGVRSSAGDSVSERLAIEAATGMNKALKLKPGQSPAYAFLGTKEAIPHSNYTSYSSMPGSATETQREVLSFLKLVNPYSRPLQTYGSSMLKLGKGSLKNATVSFGDSLSIYQQAVKAGAKTPQVLKLGSLLTTFRLSSMARRTKNILGNEFSMPYAEIHMRGGFGLDDVKGVGISTEWKDRVPEAITSMEHLLAKVGRSNIPVHDILGRGRSALSEIGESIPKRKKYSVGGMVPKYYANGGYAMGTDTVPAMLTPGEFVIKKSAVDRIGTGTLNKINGYTNGGLVGGTSTTSSDSVYNNTYEINVNVSSMSNPNDIANAVMKQIKQIDNTRVRGINQ